MKINFLDTLANKLITGAKKDVNFYVHHFLFSYIFLFVLGIANSILNNWNADLKTRQLICIGICFVLAIGWELYQKSNNGRNKWKQIVADFLASFTPGIPLSIFMPFIFI